MRRAARYADWWLPYMYSPQQLADSIAAVHQLESEVARSASMIRCGVLVFATVYEDSRLSRRVAVRSMGETYRQDFSRLVGRYVIAGDPTECQARIAEYVEAGAEAIILRPACPTEDVRPMVSRIAREVIAPLRDRRTAQ
jgi:alkanesulfonate monooxygenase SsuD/methylene tetrahydromethanopterin reductase-like flavin-dependent oxidoreductase (luciferase family)